MFYVVTVGIYDDYTILGVFDSEEKAEQAIKTDKCRFFAEDEHRIETYPRNEMVGW